MFIRGVCANYRLFVAERVPVGHTTVYVPTYPWADIWVVSSWGLCAHVHVLSPQNGRTLRRGYTHGLRRGHTALQSGCALPRSVPQR